MALPWGTSWRLSGHRDPMEATVSELTVCPPEPQHPSLDMRAPHIQLLGSASGHLQRRQEGAQSGEGSGQ